MCEKSILDPIPHIKHRPIWVTMNLVVVSQPTTFRRRFKLRKADWNGYSTELDKPIEGLEPFTGNYNRFVEYVRVVSIRYITRGCRTEYISCLTEESKRCYDTYKKQYVSGPFSNSTMKSGTNLLDNMTRGEGSKLHSL